MNPLHLASPEDEHFEQIDQTAAWLRGLSIGEVPQPIVPALRMRFGLTAGEACQAIAEARL